MFNCKYVKCEDDTRKGERKREKKKLKQIQPIRIEHWVTFNL